jgi:hypothetical protein
MARPGTNPRPFGICDLFRNFRWFRPGPTVVRAVHKKNAPIVATQWQPDDTGAFVNNGTRIPHALVAVIRDDLHVRPCLPVIGAPFQHEVDIPLVAGTVLAPFAKS